MSELGETPAVEAGNKDGDASLSGLLNAVNIASASARTAWLFFLALMGYFLVAVAGVTHEALLINQQVRLPLLGIELDLVNFFRFAPFILLLIHFGLLVQHVMLSLKVIPLDEQLTEMEKSTGKQSKQRLELHSYFYTQALAGQPRSRVFGFFLHGMVWLSFVFLPIALFIFFQVTFLPFHDAMVTWTHRTYLIADIIILAGVGIFLRKPDQSFWRALWRTGRYHPFNFLSGFALVICAFLFSMFVATIPDEWIDVQMQRLSGFQMTLPSVVETGKADTRQAFLLTAMIFEGEIDEVTGLPKTWFHRNLIVTDKDLVKNSEDEFKEVSIILKRRDLRFAKLDGSDLHRADLAGADLSGASLVESNLRDARITCPRPETDLDPAIGQTKPRCTRLIKANLTRADLTNTDLRVADLTGATLDDAELNGASLQSAQLEGTSFQRTDFRGTSWTGSNLKNADLSWSNLQGVDLAAADLRGANLENADLRGANLSYAKLQGANFAFAKLAGADLTGATLEDANFEHADIAGADLRGAKVWGTKPPSLSETKLADLRNLQFTGSKNHEWRKSDDYRIWTSLQFRSEAREHAAYGSSLSDFLGGKICGSNWRDPSLVSRIVERAAAPSYNGDAAKLLSYLHDKNCSAASLINKKLMRKMVESASASSAQAAKNGQSKTEGTN